MSRGTLSPNERVRLRCMSTWMISALGAGEERRTATRRLVPPQRGRKQRWLGSKRVSSCRPALLTRSVPTVRLRLAEPRVQAQTPGSTTPGSTAPRQHTMSERSGTLTTAPGSTRRGRPSPSSSSHSAADTQERGGSVEAGVEPDAGASRGECQGVHASGTVGAAKAWGRTK